MAPRRVPIRLVITVALTTLVVVAVCSAVIHWAGRRAVYRQQVNDLDHVAQLVREWVPPDGRTLGEPDAKRLRDVARVLGMRVTLIGGAGRRRARHRRQRQPHGQPQRPPRSRAARARAGTGDVARRSSTLEEWSVYVARLVDPGQRDGASCASASGARRPR